MAHILITIHRAKRPKQRYSFSTNRPGPEPDRHDQKRYFSASNARRAARHMLGAEWNDDGYWEAPSGKGNFWHKLVFVNNWK